MLAHKYERTTNPERYLALDVWRHGVATEKQKELAWYSLLRTAHVRACQHYNCNNTDEEAQLDRAYLLSRYLCENLIKPVRLLLYNYRRLFPTFELILELYGSDCKGSVTKLANKKKFLYMRQLARLQREYQHSINNYYTGWDSQQLAEAWVNQTTAEEKKTKHVSEYRLRTIKEMANELIAVRRRKREYPVSQLPEQEQKAAGM